MFEFKEQKCTYYQAIYQHGYSDGHASGKFQRQYKPIDVSSIFTPHYCPSSKKSALLLPYSDFLKIYTSILDIQISEISQKLIPKRC